MKRLAAMILVLGASACSPAGTEQRNGSDVVINATTGTPERNEAQADAALDGIVTVDNGTPPPPVKSPATPTPAPGVPVETAPRVSDLRREARAFPTAFQGRWGLAHADCDLSRVDDAKGLMRIAADKVSFYESSATVAAMPAKSAYKLVADLAFRGEGKTWRRRDRFALLVAGTAMSRTEQGADGGADERTYRYERC